MADEECQTPRLSHLACALTITQLLLLPPPWTTRSFLTHLLTTITIALARRESEVLSLSRWSRLRGWNRWS